MLNGFSEKTLSLAEQYLKKWRKAKYSSRRIVKEAISIAGTGKIDVETFAVLLALEKRIKQRYNTFFKRLFLYFACKREKKTLSDMKALLRLPDRVSLTQIITDAKAMQLYGIENIDGKLSGEGLKQEGEEEKEKEKKRQSPEKDSNKREQNKRTEKDGKRKEEKKHKGHFKKEDIKFKSENKKPTSSQFENKSETKKEVREDLNVADKKTSRKEAKKPETERKKTDEKITKQPSEKKQEATRRNIASANNGAYSQRMLDAEIAFAATAKAAEAELNRNFEQSFDFYNLNPDTPDQVDNREITDKKDVHSNAQGRNLNNEHSQRSDDRYAALSEENKARIAARDSIAKLSEADITAIKDAMQESLEREMEQAEQRGEIYKMPITVKEAIDNAKVGSSERSGRAEQPNQIINKK